MHYKYIHTTGNPVCQLAMLHHLFFCYNLVMMTSCTIVDHSWHDWVLLKLARR
jgi:hypothetical protein